MKKVADQMKYHRCCYSLQAESEGKLGHGLNANQNLTNSVVHFQVSISILSERPVGIAPVINVNKI
jgi:hypothetical protein